MAIKDKDDWLRVFEENLHFEPISEFRSRSDYSRKISFRELLDVGAQIDDDLKIQVVVNIFDLSQSSGNSITVLPQWVYSEDGEILEIEKPIIYQNDFYTIDDFIKICPETKYGVQIDGIQDIYSFSLSYLILATKEKNLFDKEFLTPLRSKIVKSGFERETRHGRRDEAIASERENFIIQKAEELRGRYNTLGQLYDEIRDCVYDEAKDRYQNWETNLEEQRKYNAFCCEISTIRNILGGMKNLTKK